MKDIPAYGESGYCTLDADAAPGGVLTVGMLKQFLAPLPDDAPVEVDWDGLEGVDVVLTSFVYWARLGPALSVEVSVAGVD